MTGQTQRGGVTDPDHFFAGVLKIFMEMWIRCKRKNYYTCCMIFDRLWIYSTEALCIGIVR